MLRRGSSSARVVAVFLLGLASMDARAARAEDTTPSPGRRLLFAIANDAEGQVAGLGCDAYAHAMFSEVLRSWLALSWPDTLAEPQTIRPAEITQALDSVRRPSPDSWACATRPVDGGVRELECATDQGGIVVLSFHDVPTAPSRRLAKLQWYVKPAGADVLPSHEGEAHKPFSTECGPQAHADREAAASQFAREVSHRIARMKHIPPYRLASDSPAPRQTQPPERPSALYGLISPALPFLMDPDQPTAVGLTLGVIDVAALATTAALGVASFAARNEAEVATSRESRVRHFSTADSLLTGAAIAAGTAVALRFGSAAGYAWLATPRERRP